MRSQECSRRLEALQLQAGHLLVDRQALAAGDTAAEAYRALEEVRETQAELADRARSFQTYLVSALDILEPSDAMRREITTRCAGLVELAERVVQPLSRVAGRGRRDLETHSCRVLAVNDDLQVVVLDSGYAVGVRRGTQWQIVRDDAVVARLRVIEVRADISAAVVVDGRLRNIGIGSVVTRDRP
ncbi:MAG: hypothetical protein JXR77_16490 [Lentisphaeria bacterium]|nr:hypothetical protein [Lentisphaeria bacterium]